MPAATVVSPGLRALAALNCRPGAPLLPFTELSSRLAAMPGWDYAENRISKIFRFANFHDTMAFVNAVAYVAHRQEHHPEIAVLSNRAVVTFTSYDAGGVTLNDCICAAKVETIGS
jgi:4a-hydroxytetrahydrobiopterin dehydratase